MPDDNQLYIRVNDELISVTQAVYLAYNRSKRRDRYFEHDIKAKRAVRDENGNIIGHRPAKEESLDKFIGNGADFAGECEDVDAFVLRATITNRLRDAMLQLKEDERALIDALFFSNGGIGMTVREYANQNGIPFTTVQSQKVKILATLKNFLES